MDDPTTFHGTTIIGVQRDGLTVMAGDGQVTMGNTITKGTSRKVRRLHDGKVLAGFAGATADAFTLLERFEESLKEYNGNLTRASVELVKAWRTDRVLRRLEALMLVADSKKMFLLSGSGDLIEPDGGVMAIGSGGPYALSAARALLEHTSLSAKDIALASMKIAAEICIYTNDEIVAEELQA
ncbi:MAG: ATP-dependent protease subunit ClpQ [Myxococcota bacterium]|nr:ATP-dependent protease subunit ClpQ [Myxococcota bacterium]